MAPKMPEEYKGRTNKNGGYTASSPRVWTEKELEWVQKLMAEGYSTQEIAESTDRTVTSVSIKIKRLGKKDGSYNADHVKEKYEINQKFLDEIKPQIVLDCYCGEKNFYADKCHRVSNDINQEIKADYHLDALKLLCRFYCQGITFDLIDLDPFGSAYDCFDLAIKMAKKGIVITFGEMGHKRWKRLDYVSRYYGINSLEDFTLANVIAHVQMIGRRNKKNLIVCYQREWRNIARVWFKIEPLKITEQWEGKLNC